MDSSENLIKLSDEILHLKKNVLSKISKHTDVYSLY
jgi:hypothetical protein